MATMMHSSADASATPSRWQDSQQQPPPPPANAGAVQAGWVATKKASWDKNRDQDLEREQRERQRLG